MAGMGGWMDRRHKGFIIPVGILLLFFFIIIPVGFCFFVIHGPCAAAWLCLFFFFLLSYCSLRSFLFLFSNHGLFRSSLTRQAK